MITAENTNNIYCRQMPVHIFFKTKTYERCSHFWIFQKMQNNIFEICSYTQKITTNSINALKIAIIIQSTPAIHKYIFPKTTFSFIFLFSTYFKQFKQIHFLFYYISKSHNSYFVFYIFCRFYILCIFDTLLRATQPN